MNRFLRTAFRLTGKSMHITRKCDMINKGHFKWTDPNTIFVQITRVKDSLVEYVASANWKWTGHIARLNDNR